MFDICFCLLLIFFFLISFPCQHLDVSTFGVCLKTQLLAVQVDRYSFSLLPITNVYLDLKLTCWIFIRNIYVEFGRDPVANIAF